jgi:hypothetical protein
MINNTSFGPEVPYDKLQINKSYYKKSGETYEEVLITEIIKSGARDKFIYGKHQKIHL